MVTTITSNKFLSQPGTGDEVGTWGTPINANTGVIDASFGGYTTIALANSNVILSSAQYQNQFITFTGALTANVQITFPAVGSFYTIINETTNSSNYYVTAATTAAGGRVIGLPIGSMADIMTDGVNVRFRGLPSVGTYWDYAGNTIPNWVTVCTVPPWLYCNGATFSSATFPALASLLGGTTLPDFRGRTPYNLNDGTSRITSSSGGLDGNTLFASGGAQSVTLSSVNLPNVNFPFTDPGHNHTATTTNGHTGTAGGLQFGAGEMGNVAGATITFGSCTTGIIVNSGGSGTPLSVMKPTLISGVRMIRAA